MDGNVIYIVGFTSWRFISCQLAPLHFWSGCGQ